MTQIDILTTLHGCKDGWANLSNENQVTLAGVTMSGPGIGASIRQTLANEVNRIFAKYGPAAFQSTKNAAAIHESGHVVISTTLGLRVKSVHIAFHEAGGWTGFTDCYEGAFNLSPQSTSPDTFSDIARNLCAGVIAETLFDPDFRHGSSLDEIVMSQIAGAECAKLLGVNPEQYWQTQIWAATGRTLIKHKDTVKDIASQLLKTSRIKGAQLRHLRTTLAA